MKTIKKLTFITALSMLIFSCNREKTTETTVTSETDNGVTTTTETKTTTVDYAAEKRSLKDSLSAAIDEMDKKIDALDEKISKEKGEMKAKLKEDKKALKEKNKELKERLNKIDETADSDWENFKQEFKKDAKSVGDHIDNFFEKHF